MDGKITTKTCECGTQFQTKDVALFGIQAFFRRLCDACQEKQDAENIERERAEWIKGRETEWERICPPLYRATDIDDPRLSREAVDAVSRWRDESDGVGLAIRGASGRGKTRLAFVLGKRLYMAGSSVESVTATRLAQLCVDSYDDSDRVKNAAREKLRSIRSCRYLILDDLGKQKFTDRAETELYDLIETRTSHLRPTIWTANVTSDEFAQMMSEDRGVPIIRRLSEFSTVLAL